MSVDPRLETNRRNWNERTRVHAASDFYDVEGFKAGRISLSGLERSGVGDVRGKSLLHHSPSTGYPAAGRFASGWSVWRGRSRSAREEPGRAEAGRERDAELERARIMVGTVEPISPIDGSVCLAREVLRSGQGADRARHARPRRAVKCRSRYVTLWTATRVPPCP